MIARAYIDLDSEFPGIADACLFEQVMVEELLYAGILLHTGAWRQNRDHQRETLLRIVRFAGLVLEGEPRGPTKTMNIMGAPPRLDNDDDCREEPRLLRVLLTGVGDSLLFRGLLISAC